MRYLCLFLATVSLLSAQDGQSIYNQRCASCHDHPAPRVPALSTIKAMSGEAIYRALTTGPMKTQSQGLSAAQMFALIGYIGPTGNTTAAPAGAAPLCKTDIAFKLTTGTPQWNGWSTSLTNSRFQDLASAGLAPTDLPKLKLKWAFNLGDVTQARSQPAVVDGRLFVGSMTGTLYALDADTGCTRWSFHAASPIRAGATLGESNNTPAVFFGDTSANIYALNAQNGELIWKTHPVDHYAAIASSAPRYYNGIVYQSFSSFEEVLGGNPKFECCTFRGSVVALDARTGAKLWQTFTIPEAAKPTIKNQAGTQQYGPSGAGIWSTPTIDEQRGVLYVGTGDNYSDPPTATSDAILAMDLKTGKLLWSAQVTANDAYNNGCAIPVPADCPQSHGADSDFGQPPILVSLGTGKRALVIAQKSGMVHALDPDDKGKVLWQTRVGAGGPLGGSQWGSASDGEKIYVAVSDIGLSGAPDPKSPQGFRLVLDPKKGGGLHALDLRTGKIVWTAKPDACDPSRTDCSPAQSAAVTAIPGVIFSGSVDGHLRAYSATDGGVLWDFDTAKTFDTVSGQTAHGGSIDVAGPVIVNGMLFVNSGYGQWGGMPGNVLLAFSAR